MFIIIDGDNMKRKKRLKIRNISKLIVLIILIVLVIIGIKQIAYKQSNEYKLKELGYKKEQITEILKLESKYINKVLSVDYNEFLLQLFKEKYFIYENIDRYLKYHSNHQEVDATNVVAIINVNGDYEHYTNVQEADLNKDLLVLVNKYNYLSKNYKPDDLEEVINWYAFGENTIKAEVYDQFIDMYNDAKEENLTLIITSGFRDYELQNELYVLYQDKYGKEEADQIAARPGFSEHQTGLCLDIVTYDVEMEEFEETKEFEWLQENAYKYGFILRYPKGKELITGYNYESWHYRYVGIDIATKIHELGITFDEYYNYFIK